MQLSKGDIDNGSSERSDAVKEQTGFRVSTLYISQVKRKCCLEVGESYNKPKSEDAKQPKCTQEKEEAVMQALRHYGMI